MSTNTSRSESDTRFTTAAMAWLRTMLVAPIVDPVPVPAPKPEPATSGWWSRKRKIEAAHSDPVATSLPPSDPSIPARTARAELVAAVNADPAPRFTRFCDAFALQPFERDVLLLGFAHAVSTEIARLCRAMPESVNGYPTFALALGLAADPTWDALPPESRPKLTRLAAVPEWDALGSDRPLRYWRILEIHQPASQAFVSSPLRVDERIVDHLMGRDYIDGRISSICRPVSDNPRLLSTTQSSRVDETVGRIRLLGSRNDRVVVQMPDGDVATKQLYAAAIADAVALPLHTATSDRLIQDEDSTTLALLWNREAIMQPLSIFVATAASGDTAAGRRFAEDLRGLVFRDTAGDAATVATLLLDTPRPTRVEQWTMWNSMLGSDSGQWSERLAGQFDLNVGDFADAAALAGTEGAPGERIWEHYRGRARPRLEGLAQLVTTATTLDDVQLPADEKRTLAQLCEQARDRLRVYDGYGFRHRLGRGLGLTALFAGQSGTGKTMAAEAIATTLALDLFRVDLASVVSKYIGETEKNLAQIFDAAEISGAVLLFDEADAVFGKRGEVHDSHDRYANIEVSYLLQRMEAYTGLAVLTTNMKTALDEAFLRRLRFVVEFPFPNVTERRKIWAGVFPRAVSYPELAGLEGIDDLDLDKLARPSLTGGQIRNIALNGAFSAAAADDVITMELLRDAARDELRKNGKPFSAGDFADWNSRHRNEIEEREAV